MSEQEKRQEIRFNMPELREDIPSDDRLAREIVIELNVSCRNVAIYPRDHPAVRKSLYRVCDSLQKLFELRREVTLAVGKDTLIINDQYLDKKNRAYRLFAQHLRGLNIAYIIFSPGLSIDELYDFQCIISRQAGDLSHEDIRGTFNHYDLTHIQIGFVEYDAFSFEEGKDAVEIPQEDLWEQYILGVITGSLHLEEVPEEIGDIDPDIFGQLFNRLCKDDIDRSVSQKIITTYIRKFFQRTFSKKEMKRLLDFINGLPAERRRQFLSAVVETLSRDEAFGARSIHDMSADLVIELFETIRSEGIAVPETLKNLLEKLLHFDQRRFFDHPIVGNVVDDIILPLDIVEMVSEGFAKETLSDACETSESEAYNREIQKILEFDASDMVRVSLTELKKECDDDFIEKNFNFVILELMSSDIVSQREYRQLVENLREQTEQFLWTGQYEQILKIIHLLQMHVEEDKFADIASEALEYYYSQEFYSTFIGSLKIIGRQARDAAWQLCEFFGETVIPFLMDALVNEGSQTFRSLLLSLLKHFGEKIVPEALRRLDDTRWFVKRNMLYLLTGCENKEVIPYLKPYCRHENSRVRFEAIKCLLNLEEPYGFEVIKEYLLHGSKEENEQAITLLGAFRVMEAVPDLVQMLRKKMSKADLSQRLCIIQALGNMGDSRSLDVFREILSSKNLFFRGGLEKLKEEIYRTLKNYPYQDIEGIIQTGLQSKNESIKSESLRLSRTRTR